MESPSIAGEMEILDVSVKPFCKDMDTVVNRAAHVEIEQ